jgi:hypothetical protein
MLAESDANDRGRVFEAIGAVAGVGADFVRNIVGGKTGGGDDMLDRVTVQAATVAAGGKKFELVKPDLFIPFLPHTVAGMPRVSAAALYDAPLFTLKGSMARARYARGDSYVEFELGDMGELSGLARVFAWFDPAFTKTSGCVHERSGRTGGRYFQERFDERDGSGKFGLMFDDRFAVAARGSGVMLAALHDAVNAVDRAGVGRARQRPMSPALMPGVDEAAAAALPTLR